MCLRGAEACVSVAWAKLSRCERIAARARAPPVALPVLYVSDNLRLTDGASRSFFSADFLRMKFAAPTSCRSQLVGAEEFVFNRRLEKNERLARS